MNDTDFNGIKQNSHQMRIYCVRLSLCVCVCAVVDLILPVAYPMKYTRTYIQTRCILYFYSKLTIRNRKNLAVVSI